jgi:hypothetical protein
MVLGNRHSQGIALDRINGKSDADLAGQLRAYDAKANNDGVSFDRARRHVDIAREAPRV